jgi:hypothetical protein
MNKAERVLVLLLRLMGIAEVCAFIGLVMPTAWMAAAHERLGLGAFPEAPIAPYLARCLSAFYMMHGGVLLICASDVRRYATLIVYVAVTGIVFSAVITVLDVVAGLPWYWTVGEGPFLTAISVAFLLLLRRVLKESRPAAAR